jgi:hypothetical protein
MTDLQREIRKALQTYLADDDSEDDSELEHLISSHPEIIGKHTGKYPDVHRLMDVMVGDKLFTVLRQISKGEKIHLQPIDVDFFSEKLGVPLWVTGEALKRWAEEEENDPRKEEVRDWQRFFRPEPE